MEEPSTIQVNFGKPFPLFPLDGVALMPHSVLRLFIFEPRYRQMVEDVLEGTGQIAMAIHRGDPHDSEIDPVPIRPAVCVGQIVRYERLPDGTYHLWLQGVCRAQVVQEDPPDEVRLYRQAVLRPLEPGEIDESILAPHRAKLSKLLDSAPLNELPRVRFIINELNERATMPTHALLEAVTLAVIPMLGDNSLQYRLLEEGDARLRASIIEHELGVLNRLLRKVGTQYDPDAPKGVSWN